MKAQQRLAQQRQSHLRPIQPRGSRVATTLLALALLSGVTALGALAGDKAADTPAPKQPSPTVKPEALGGSDRYLLHVQTDKPIYRLGEKLYARVVALNADTHAPLSRGNTGLHTQYEIIGPKGDVVAGGFSNGEQPDQAVTAASWEIPDTLAGGEYTLRVTSPHQLGAPPAERKFDIRAYRAPRLKTQIEFIRDGYGPGDTVTSTVSIERAEGGIPQGATVTIQARVDGDVVHTGKTTVGADGFSRADFTLPDEIARGEGTLSYIIQDGGVVETASKTIPILLQTVDLNLYPEGGSLVKGLPSRVYFEAKTPAQKPADIAGVIVDSRGKEVATFKSEHEGRGRFDFTPAQAGEAYSLKITQPTGIKTTYKLPTVLEDGAVIRTTADRYGHDEPLTVQVGVLDGRRVTVTLSEREKELASVTTKGVRKLGPYTPTISFTPPTTADGVLVVTVRDAETNVPLAERLIYREPASRVNVAISADRKRYTPGQPVELTIKATDEAGEPVEAVVGVTVTDDSVLEMIEKREQAPRLPVMVLLENEVDELADAHVYLDHENAEAPLALDLLLGTQGWRRFAFIRTEDFLREHGDDARRVLAMQTVTQRELMALGRNGGGGGMMLFEAAGVAGQEGAAVRHPGAMPRIEAEAVVAEAAQAQAQGDLNGRAQLGQAVDKLEAAVDLDASAPQATPDAAPVNEEMAERKDDLADREAPGGFIAGEPMMRKRQAASSTRPANGPVASQPLQQALEMQVAQAEDRRMILGDRALNRAMPQRNDFVVVREYAHSARPNRQAGDRRDFTETLYFGPAVRTNASTGEATVRFDLSDAVTAFRVDADAFTHGGSLGSGTTTVESVEPFYAEPKLPLEVTAGDLVTLPIGLVNGTEGTLTEAKITIAADPGIKVGSVESFEIPGDTRIRRLVDLDITQGAAGETDFAITAIAGIHMDKVTRKLRVVPRGFPTEVAFGGMLEADGSVSFDVVIPESMVPGSMVVATTVSPTPLANMTQAMERLIQEPYGCFEQASSTTYPLVMAQQYFTSHHGVDPALISRSSAMLDKGYAKLVSFECSDRGYEWFGESPGHEALTAYGVLEFHDMAKVHPVDADMLKRTRGWLLDMRDGKGGFTRERRALHTWVADPDASNAYCTWALLEAGEPASNLKKEVATVLEAGRRSDNAYVKAIAANVAQAAGDSAAAKAMMDSLKTQQTEAGHVDGATTSIVGSGGDALKIETTSFAMLAWLKDPAYTTQVEKAAEYLAETCKAGRFGSTQSTILALRGIVEYDKARAGAKAPGSIAVYVDGSQVAQPVAFDAEAHGALELPDLTAHLTPGKHTVELKMTGGSQMPASLAINFFNLQPDSSDACVISLETTLRDAKIAEGSVTEVAVNVANTTDKAVPNPIAIVGLPGGFEPRHDQLKELVKQELIAAYEVRGREVILYWRSFDANQKLTLPISVTAAVPGKYTGPASRAYLYYTDEHKQWQPGLAATITPRGE